MRGVLASLAALTISASVAPAAPADVQPYNIDVITSQTGGGSFLGKEEQQALSLAETLFNKSGGIHGRPVHFTFYDDQSSPQTAVQLLSGVLGHHPAVVLGATLTSSCNAMQFLVKNGPVLYCFSPGVHPPSGSYMFSAEGSTYDQVTALIRYFRGRGWKKIALMTSTDATGQDADRAIDNVLAKSEFKDIDIVSRVHFNPGDVSVVAQLQKVKGANPQAFIGWSTGSPSATIFRDAEQAGLKDLPMGTSGGNMEYAQMDHFSAFLPTQLYMPVSEWPVGDDPHGQLEPEVKVKQAELYAAYKKAGLRPDEGTLVAWDPGQIVVDALRRLPPDPTAKQLHDDLVGLKGAAGIGGLYDFTQSPQRGLSIKDIVVEVWDPSIDTWRLVSKPSGAPLPASD